MCGEYLYLFYLCFSFSLLDEFLDILVGPVPVRDVAVATYVHLQHALLLLKTHYHRVSLYSHTLRRTV